MTNTFAWTDAHDYPSGDSFRDWPFTGLTLPGHVFTNYTVTLNHAVTGTTIINLNGGNGPWTGSTMWTLSIPAGSTTAAGTSGTGTTIPSSTTTFYVHQLMNALTSVTSGLTTTVTWTFTDVPDPPPCQYGTQRNSTAAVYSVIVEDLVVALAAAFGGGPLLVLGLSVLIGLPIAFPVCEHPPPVMPVFVDSDWIAGTAIPTPAGLGKLGQWFTGALWWFYCECIPAPSGSPPPVIYPKPPPPPPLAPTGPQDPLVCSNSDICSALNKITNELTALLAMVTQMYGRTTLPVTILPNQTWHPLSNYTKGAVHTGLTGTGAFAISGVDGFEVQITTRGPSIPALPGNPPYQWNVGWVSINNFDGMIHEKRITQLGFLWFPDQCLLGTSLNYALDTGNVISITELHAA